MKIPEYYRCKNHPLFRNSSPADGANGFFIFPHYKVVGYEIRCQCSDSKIWLPIKGYEDLYHISNYGEIKALHKEVAIPNGATRIHQENILSLESANTGYLRVSLNRNGDSEKKLVHVLVAEHFIGNPNNYPIVNHKDGNKLNAVVTNLEWCDMEYNFHHAIENGLKGGLKAQDIEEIKKLLSSGIPIAEVAESFNRSRQTISDVKHGRHRSLSPNPPTGYTGLPLWEHVSVTIAPKGKAATRCPTWEEMCWVKEQFWTENECVVEYHPPKSEYVSFHNFCLHLWRPTGQALPMPDAIMVGPKSHVKP